MPARIPSLIPAEKLHVPRQIFLPFAGNRSLPGSPKDGDVLGYSMDLDAGGNRAAGNVGQEKRE